jgi:hypothetical protein
MTRRTLLASLVASRLRAGADAELWDLLSSMASALAAGDAPAFLQAFDPAMPGYGELRIGVEALVREAQLESAVEVMRNEGDGAARSLEIDWTLTITSRQDGAVMEQRRRRATCRARKTGSKWKLVAFEPAALFAPPAAR